MPDHRKLRIGIVGAGEVSQTVNLCGAKFHIAKTTTRPEDIFNDPEIDLVLVFTSDEYHSPYTVAALQAGKHVMVKKPMTLSLPSAERIIEAENAAAGPRVFVGYMRRYAPSFVEAFKSEILTIDRILYARSRDIIGPNSHFVGQSGTCPEKFSDSPPGSNEERLKMLDGLLQECFPGAKITPARQMYCRFLGSLGSHDLSLMREALGGLPESVAGLSVNGPFYSAIFNYRNRDGTPFSVTYESGIDDVPRLDAHLAVYGLTKTLTIEYDTAYVKGLPIKVRVEEKNPSGHAVKREILCPYQDAYTSEFLALYECLVEGKDIKTSAMDAYQDLKLFEMMFKKYETDLAGKD